MATSRGDLEYKMETNEPVIINGDPLEDMQFVVNTHYGNGRNAQEMIIPAPFHYVAEVISHVVDFFPLMTAGISQVYDFPAGFPKKIEIQSVELLDEVFRCYKTGLEQEPGSQFQFGKVRRDNLKLHISFGQHMRSQTGLFSNYYNTIIVTAKDQQNTTVHYETGCTSRYLSDMMAKLILYPRVAHNDRVVMRQMYRWIITPVYADISESARRQLVRLNPIESNNGNFTCIYNITTTLACSTNHVLAVLKNTETVANEIIPTSTFNKTKQSFSLRLEPMGEYTLTQKVRKDNTKSNKAASYRSQGLFPDFKLDFAVTTNKADANTTDLSVEIRARQPLFPNAVLRIIHKENVVNLISTLFGNTIKRVEKEVKHDVVVSEYKAGETVPQDLKLALGFKN